MDPVISIRQLSKTYRKRHALNSVSLDVPQGTILGIVGNNGSGKTTLLKACMGLIRPSAGQMKVLGRNPWKQRHLLCRDVGYIPDMTLLDGWMKIKELLRFVQHIHPNWNQEKATDLFRQSRLDMDQKIGTLSKGMREKLYLLMVLSINSKLMILDEPTLGLDIPFRRLYLDQLLSDYFTDERTIVIATHQLEEFERIFDQVVFLDQGRLVLHEPVDELKKRFSIVVLNTEQTGLIDPQNRHRLGGFIHEERYLVRTDILSGNEQLAALPTKEPDLTDVFLGVVEGGLR